MALQTLVGLFVKNDKLYQKYRDEMIPILEEYGGGFTYDFKINEVLKSETEEPINRVFVIYFKDEKSKNDFFSNPQYLQIKKKYFQPSVEATTIIAEYIQ